MSFRNFAPDQTEQQLDLVAAVRRFGGLTATGLTPLFNLELEFNNFKERLNMGSWPHKSIQHAVLFIVTSGFFIGRWIDAVLNAKGDAENFLIAAKANADQASAVLQGAEPERPSVRAIAAIVSKISSVSTIEGGLDIFREISAIQLPLSLSTEERPSFFAGNEIEQNEPAPAKPLILSVVLFFQDQYWANPQVIRPNYLFKIRGHLKLNYLPEGYTELLLYPASTTDDSWYKFTLKSIGLNSVELDVEGGIVFTHEQGFFEDIWTLKLNAQLKGPGKEPLNPEIVGYDELKVKVLSPDSLPILVRYPNLNVKIHGILADINKAMADLLNQEREDFALFLSSILNYQGHCAERGTYRGVSDLDEEAFRDNLFIALDMDRELASQIIKEGHLAGGRVEISYRGIIAELKVEKSETDRAKVIDAHWRQAAAYATGSGKRLSVLCILDLTRKNNPPALAANNVFLMEPEYHGFDAGKPSIVSRLVVVFIDGNLPRPSDL